MRRPLLPRLLPVLLLLAALLTSGVARAGAREQPPVNATIVRVHDGDTLTVDVPGWPPLHTPCAVRLIGLDAPEMDDPRPDIQALAVLARDWLRARLSVGAGVTLHDFGRDKYGRLLCHVEAEIDGERRDVGDELLRRGLARPYTGRNPKPW